MTTGLFSHPSFGRHETPEGHAEQKARYHSIETALNHEKWGHLGRFDSPIAEWGDIERAHQSAYVELVRDNAPHDGMVSLDPDTFMGQNSLEAARRGAGGAIAAVDKVMAGDLDNAFVASRPPGHHAVPDRAMGFCLFNNAAIAALHVRAKYGLQKVAVVDFDVHHGNGTQDIFFHDENAFFASSHEWPQYPGTGQENERGDFDQIRNVPLASGEGSQTFQRAWGDHLLPALQDFSPEFIVISAGFDAHAADPLGGLNLLETDFAWVTHQISQLAKECAEGRIVSVLEGGYDLEALATSVEAHIGALSDQV